MVKAVLVQGSTSKYDDQPGRYYHFPRRYLKRIEQCVDDWVVFFTPVKDTGVSAENRGSYRALAKLGSITPDPNDTEKFYVSMQSGTYLSFASAVPRTLNGQFIERAMQGSNGQANTGVALQAVRPISNDTFAEIVSHAWPDEHIELPRHDEAPNVQSGFQDQATPFIFDVEREVVATLINKKIRDRRFRLAVLHAYEKRCAITGWDFINGGGRAEAEAAHIKPVEHDGPDSIDNGLALSGTVHWMFDRGLIGIANDDEIMISRKVNDPERIRTIINPTGKLIRPKRPEHQPHPAFLAWHREHHRLAA